MNLKRLFFAAAAAFAVIFVLDILVHGRLLMGLYEETASVWRPKEEARGMMWLMTLNQLLFALALTWFYTKGFEAEKPGFAQGMRFGLYAGLTVAASQCFVWYVVLPVPFALNISWVASSFINTLASGAVIGLIYRR